jgi:hypothetical protein
LYIYELELQLILLESAAKADEIQEAMDIVLKEIALLYIYAYIAEIQFPSAPPIAWKFLV